MAKQKASAPDKGEKVKVLAFYQKEGAFGFVEFEVDEAAIKAAKIVDRSEPDLFAVFLHNITKKSRAIFGI